MKKTKRLGCLLLVLALLAALSVSAFAAGAGLNNFTRSKTYSGQYSDVSSADWAFSVIKTCYETGLMQGSDGRFNGSDSLTVAQALVMADRVHQIYNTGANTLQNGDPWYQTYVDYALTNGIISSGEFSDWNGRISRADMALVFSRALPSSELAAIKTVYTIPDLSDAPARDRDAIRRLYQAGVLTGSDKYGTFKPNDPITRNEAAAIIARVAIPSERRSGDILYHVTDGIVTFGPPQTNELIKDVQEYGTSYTVRYSAIVGSIVITSDSSMNGLDLTAVYTPTTFASSLSGGQDGLQDVRVSKVTFGSLNAYRATGYYHYTDQDVQAVQYWFIYGSALYSVSVTWGEGADRTELQTTLDALLINGSPASPAYLLP